jgi:hypothetical protein
VISLAWAAVRVRCSPRSFSAAARYVSSRAASSWAEVSAILAWIAWNLEIG